MSVRWMAYVFGLDLPPKTKVVALALAAHANDAGLAWPRISTLAIKASVDGRTVQRHLRDLAARGVVDIVPPKNGGAANE
jgi:DNA-binding IscR family transcriptional regulator